MQGLGNQTIEPLTGHGGLPVSQGNSWTWAVYAAAGQDGLTKRAEGRRFCRALPGSERSLPLRSGYIPGMAASSALAR